MNWRFWKTHPRFDAELALELLRFTGKAYVQYLEARYGADPQLWRPRHMRGKYERYSPGPIAPPFEQVETIRWRERGSSLWPIGYLARRKREWRLIFRGTVSDREWLKDVQLAQTDCPVPAPAGVHAGSTHLGFTKIYKSLKPSPAELAPLFRKHDRLRIAGHSLGGALATFAAFELREFNPETYVFGCPRPGDGAFADAVQRFAPQLYRIENVWDPIADSPAREVRVLTRVYPYRHAGEFRPVFSLSKMDGDRLVHALGSGKGLADYLLSGGDIDLLFTHQLRTYEHGLAKLIWHNKTRGGAA